jgi:uncharacterized protein YicC (UPF0701 family)
MLELTSLTFLTFFVSAYQHTAHHGARTVASSETSAGQRRDSRQGLDFLMQELHREANTLGSKSVDAEVSRASMEMKLLTEQMRERIQNLE